MFSLSITNLKLSNEKLFTLQSVATDLTTWDLLLTLSELIDKPMPTSRVPKTNQRAIQESAQPVQPVQNSDNTFTVSESVLIRIVEDMVEKIQRAESLISEKIKELSEVV